MVKKRKKKAKNRGGKKVKPQNLPAFGKRQIECGKFSEAIKTFRQLLKNDGDERWLSPLSRAYRGRIEQLTAKGMAKEALVVYTNMVTICLTGDHCLHINLLLKNGHYQQALELFATLEKSLSEYDRQVVEEMFAALLLSGEDQALKHLPYDSLLKKHYPHADQAITAYCQGDYAAVENHLKNISFRSPYKNFRFALKGMLAFAENRNKAALFFEKIAKNSPFFHWITPYCQLNSFVNPSAKLSRIEKQIVQTLEGIDKSTRTFLDGIRARQNEPFKLYSFLVTQGLFLGRYKLQNICFRILSHAPDRFPAHQQSFSSLIEHELDRQLTLPS
ncbi:MAG: hypothetical protein J7L69_09140, partial [Desulfobulbaceae bacterium]|nr:hypothetical protein [Desulfobulbaceae bacterium]